MVAQAVKALSSVAGKAPSGPYLTVATVGKEGTSLWKLAYRKAFHQ